MSLRPSSRTPALANDDDDDDDFYRHGDETQKLLVREQDDQIRSLATSVERVQGMAIRVNEELVAQNRMIDDIDSQVEETDSRLRSMNTQLKKLAADKDRGKYGVICLLLLLLFWLTNMVLSDD